MRDRYWVGGSGLWNDAMHWSETSGGTGGGPEIAPGPLATDNAIFDINSGSGDYTVTITALSICLSLTVDNPANGHVTFLSLSWGRAIGCYGSIYFTENTVFEGRLGLKLMADTLNETIKVSNCPLLGQLTKEGQATYTLLSDLRVQAIRIRSGTFDANGYNIYLTNLLIVESISTVPSILYMGSGTWTLTMMEYDPSPTFWWLVTDSEYVFVYPETAHIKFIWDLEGSIYHDEPLYIVDWKKTQYNTITLVGRDHPLFYSPTLTVLVGHSLSLVGLNVTELIIKKGVKRIGISDGQSITLSSLTVEKPDSEDSDTWTIINNITLGSDKAFLKKVGGPVTGCDYVKFRDIGAQPAAGTWYVGPHSTGTNSTGLIFSFLKKSLLPIHYITGD